ncbi:NAD(+)/NADH kinase [candidate division WOR-3 bacterium]|nr:NAD(+)/NADH kinase [candidate division WOR-3 bacterium]
MKKTTIVINAHKPTAKKLLPDATRILLDHGFTVSRKPDFVIVIGGDGTMLNAAQVYCRKEIPILGINIGGLGFLTDVTLHELPMILDQIKQGRYAIEKRMMVQATFNRSSLYALNDISIVTKIPGRAVELSATINKEHLYRFLADGIIIATPTGSTAYSLATGGPILIPSTEGLIITPIAPHTLSVRPMVLPATSVIKLKVGQKGKAILVADGQHSKMIPNGRTVIFKRAHHKVCLVKPHRITFIGTLREKMKWGGREDA